MIKRLARCIRQYKLNTILTPLFMLGEVGTEVLIPFLMAKLIDNGVDKGDISYILKFGGLIAVSCLISLTFGTLSGRHAAIASGGFARNLRHDMFYNLQNYSFANIDKFSTASIVTRLTTDVTNLQNSFQMLIRIAVRSPAMLIFSLIMAVSINSKLALIFLCAVPLLGIGLALIMKTAFPIFGRVFRKYDKLNSVVQENLRGIRVVKSFVREKHEEEKFNNVSESIYDDFVKAEKTLAFNMPLMQVCMYACLLLVSWFGARIIVTSGGTTMTTGQLSSLITYTMQILSSLMMLSMIFVSLTLSRASAERAVEVLEEKSTLTNGEKPVYTVKNGDILFENVGFEYYEGKECLHNINLKINSGETIGIIGGTGSGKSTLVSLLPRLYDVTCGKVSVGGVDVRDYDLNTLRESVAVVLQKNVLFSGTIKENLRWGNENATDDELIHACKLAQAHEFIMTLEKGYDTYIEQGGTNVSGGQKQRICIARALVKKPKILILDDSTSAVDTKTDALIKESFKNEIPATTKLIIAQRISSVCDADRIIVIDGGKIDGFGTHSELMRTNAIYNEVARSQEKGGEE